MPDEGRWAARGSRFALTRVPPQVERVPCPYDVHHRVPRASLERHAASCRLRKMGYSAEEQVGWGGGRAVTGRAGAVWSAEGKAPGRPESGLPVSKAGQ